MGNKNSTGALLEQANHEIDVKSDEKKKSEKQIHKLLLLGAGSSGKSTLLKQIKYLYIQNKHIPRIELNDYKLWIHKNILDTLQRLIRQSNVFKFKLNNKLEEYANEIIEIQIPTIDKYLDSSIKHYLRLIWKDDAIQKTYKLRDSFLLMDNAEHFMSNLERMLDDNYIPNIKDVLLCRTITAGIRSYEFTFSSQHIETSNNRSINPDYDTKRNIDDEDKSWSKMYQVYDVGGQRSERRKWIQLFDNVDSIVFVISLCGYNQTLYEDERQNRLLEGLELLENVTSLKYFRHTKFYVFLNKCDLFKLKLKTIKFDLFKNKYKGNRNNFEQIKEYIIQEIRRRSHNKIVDIYLTTAINEESVKSALNQIHINFERFKKNDLL